MSIESIRRVVVVLAFACGLSGCRTGAGYVVRDPAISKCQDSGLRGCEDIVEGFIAYAEGRAHEGQEPLRKGIGQNLDDPDSVERFADAMLLLRKVPPIGGYIASLEPALKMLRDSAADAKKAPGYKPKPAKVDGAAIASAASAVPASGGGVRPASAPTTGTGQTKTIIVGGHPAAKSCMLLGAVSAIAVPGGGAARCVSVADGAVTVSDIHVASGCASVVFVGAGSTESPRWIVTSSPGQQFDMHGARLVADPGETLFVGQLNKDSVASGEFACAVTLTGG